MVLNNIPFMASLEDILIELQSQMRLNDLPYLHIIKDGADNIQCQCPYHSGGMEKRPSAGIRKSDGVFHCFACGATYSLQQVISHCFGKDDDITGAFGWSWLLKNFLTINVEERKDVHLDFCRSSRCDSSISITKFVTDAELDSYRYYHPYMYKRKLTDEVIDLYDIGYDKITDCITFPVRDKDGNCLFVTRRSVKSKYFYIPTGVSKPLYGVYELPKSVDEIIVCESQINTLTCRVYGKWSVGLFGTGTQEQCEMLANLPCRKLILALDPDSAGSKGKKRIRKYIGNRKIITEYILPTGKDINDLTNNEFNKLEEIF